MPPLRTILVVRDAGSARDAVAAGADLLVAEAGMPQATAKLVANLRSLAPGQRLAARLRPLSELIDEPELEALMAASPDVLLLPGATGQRDVARIGAALSVWEAEYGLADGVTRLIFIGADTAAGVLALPELRGRTGTRLAGIGCDPVRLAADLGCAADAPALIQARAATVLVSAVARVPAILFVGEEVEASAVRAARQEGFSAFVAARAATIATIREALGGPDQARVGRSSENFVSGVATK